MKTLSLVGGARTTRHLYKQYPADEIWTLAYLHKRGFKDERITLLFEMHKGEDIPQERLDYIMDNWDNLPPVMLPDTYPKDEVTVDLFENLPCIYLSSSFDYMLGLGIYYRFSRIQILGYEMEMTNEWFYQRPGAYLMMGIAAGRGIEIFIPEQSKLMKPQLYGYNGIPKIDPQVTERLDFVRRSFEGG